MLQDRSQETVRYHAGRLVVRPLTPDDQVHQPCVLLAEDDPEMRALLSHYLIRAGYQVIEAGSGTSVVRYLSNHGGDVDLPLPDVLVSDVRMPGLSGLEMLRAVRGYSSIPVILITAFGDAEVHREAQALGAHQVIDKPFELDQLRAAVRAALPDPR